MVWPQEYLLSVVFLLASSGTSIHYLPPFLSAPWVFFGHRYCRLHSPQADTGLALSKLHDVLSGYINKHPDAAFIIAGILTKPTSGRSCRTFTSMYPVQLEDWIHWIIATLSLRMPTKPAHYRLLANRTMPPFFSHRNINKGSLRNPRWREKWRAGPPTQKLCYRRLLMTSTGTCSGRVHLTSVSSRMLQWAL